MLPAVLLRKMRSAALAPVTALACPAGLPRVSVALEAVALLLLLPTVMAKVLLSSSDWAARLVAVAPVPSWKMAAAVG